MQSDQHLNYYSGELSIYPQLGEVSNAQGQLARLGPVNMKVLALLISRPQTLVNRGEIFAAVWKNQEVSDDALTRCISDIRSQLKTLCPSQEFIETLPRRGYRWLLEVSEVCDKKKINTEIKPEAVNNPANLNKSDNSHSANRKTVTTWFGRIAFYLLGFILIASLSVWILDRFSQPNLPVVAILPNQHPALLMPQAMLLEEALMAKLLPNKSLQILSKTAIASRPSNPFPYLYFEFGVRWVVESELQAVDDKILITLTLVDARTGIILHQTAESLPADLILEPGTINNNQTLIEFVDYLSNVTEGI